MEMTLSMGAFGALDQQELFAVDGGVKVLDVGMGVAGVYSAGVGVVGLLWYNQSCLCWNLCSCCVCRLLGDCRRSCRSMYGLVT